jgi:ATP-dependent RNA helicase RhlE
MALGSSCHIKRFAKQTRSTLHPDQSEQTRPHPESAGVGHGTRHRNIRRKTPYAGPEPLGFYFPLTQNNFEAFGFAEPLARALDQCGYQVPTPIQASSLRPQLDGRDLLALAETGSGKTAAFLLPILQDFAASGIQPGPREVLALVLAPTRELALQIDQEVASLTRNLHTIRRSVVLGGVSKGPQINALKRGLHILVATPGRLLDHVSERHADLRPVRTFVLDEADRMFDMGFIRDIRKIASMLSHKRRTAMFSATMPAEIRTLANELLNEPFRVDLSPKQVVVDRIDQKMMIVPAAQKQGRLHKLLQDVSWSRVIVFTRTKRGADRVTDRLTMAGIGAVAIHGNKAQNARQRALKDFSLGHVRVLVATDIAARGIDVSDVTHVVNFDMPTEPETYVHRIGRTARRGLNGAAMSLCDPSETGEIRAIERLMKQPIEVIADTGGVSLPPLAERPERSDSRPHGRSGPRRDFSDRNGRPSRSEGQPPRRDARSGDRDRSGRGEQSANGQRRDRPAGRSQPEHGELRRDHQAPASRDRGDQRRPHEGRPHAHADARGADARPAHQGKRDHTEARAPQGQNGRHRTPHASAAPHRPERHASGHAQGAAGEQRSSHAPRAHQQPRPQQARPSHTGGGRPQGGHARGTRDGSGSRQRARPAD